MSIHVQARFVAPPSPVVLGGDYIRRFAELRQGDFELAGRKGASLGELHSAHFPVPEGFVITTPAYLHAMEVAGVREKLGQLSRDAGATDQALLARDAQALRDLVQQAGLSPDLESAIALAYRALGDAAHVIVRSSASHEDRAGTALGDRCEVFFDVAGEAALFAAVVSCWMSVWGERVIAYRAGKGSRSEPAIAVVVQRMIDTKTSGAIFSTDPLQPDAARIVVEPRAQPGALAGTTSEPVTYLIHKQDRHLLEVRTGAHAHCTLSEHDLFSLLNLAKDAERHYQAPQHVEWALYEGTLYVLRSRPLTPPAQHAL